MADKVKQVNHGGNILAMAARLGCGVDDLIDMSSNLTPLGVVPGLHEEITAKLPEIAHLPETGSESLIDCFADTYNLNAKQILAGNGTTEFIFGVPAAMRPKRAVIVGPTYADYHLACSWADIDIVDFPLLLADDFNLDFNKLAAVLQDGDMVFICNPNNPTGRVLASDTLHAFCKEHGQCTFMIDESYMYFVRDKSLLEMPTLDNLLILNSYSKIYGIPGLRLGFLAAPLPIMAKLGERRKPWGVNRVAQIAGEFLCKNADPYVAEVVDYIGTERPRLVQSLTDMPGVRVIEGATNFILCYLEGKVLAPELQERLLEKRIMVRNCANFTGLSERFFRISLQDAKTNSFCLAALAEILQVKA